MKKIVIIGGGFAGSLSARKLQKEFDVTLIDNKDYFEFTPSVLRTLVEPKHVKKIETLHKNYLKKAKFVFGDVKKIDKKNVFVKTKKYPYDYLIISSGSSYKAPFKEKDIVQPNRSKELIEYHKKLENAKNICVVGGGLVGVELIGEILCKYKNKKITLFHHNKKLIPRNNKKSGSYIEKLFRKKGVILNMEEGFEKKDKSGFDLVFMCVGIVPNLNFGISKDELKVNDFLQLKDHKNIFVAGDVANLKEEKTAQNAEHHARIIIENIKRLEKKESLKKYKSRKRPFLISLGKYNGILEYRNFTLSGLIPALLKDFTEKIHMAKLR